MKLVVFGYGNPSRGDDGLGPWLLQKVGEWAGAAALKMELVCDFQLQVEHALDLEDCDCALFLDARVNGTEPFSLEAIGPMSDKSWSSHFLSPQAVLAVHRDVLGKAPPPAYLLSIRGEDFGLGRPLSDTAKRNGEAAWACLRMFLQGLTGDLAASGTR